MAFLTAVSGGSGGGINPSSSQSSAIETGDFNGGTVEFGPVALGSGAPNVAGGDRTGLYIGAGIAAVALLVLLMRK